MKLFDSFRSALQSIIVNKLRSALTMLGVIIGVASVIAMVAVGNGASETVQTQVLALGSNLVTVTPGAQRDDSGLRGAGVASQNLTLDDMNAIAQQLGPTVAAVEAEQTAGRWQVTAAGQNWSSNVVGVTPDYPKVREWSLASGDFFTDSDLRVNAQVAVIGSTTATNLFGEGVDPVGQTIQLRQVFGGPGGGAARARIVNFKVIGMLETKGSTFGFSRDDQILVPTTTAQRVLTGRTNSVNAIIVKAASNEQMVNTTADVTDVLLQRHKITDAASPDFTVTNQNDTLAALNQITGTFTILLAAIGGISLLVGGIGIMNIMLVSVNERTREIGIRKAVGARRRDILTQFLIEAIGLTGIGGVLGILLGWGITVVVHQIPAASQLPILITAGTVAVAVGVSVGIGVVFGLYPAMRAARLHPIQALRYE